MKTNQDKPTPLKTVDVVIVGGGASGTTAALQAARMGARVLLIEETSWLGGMLTSAGVSALDGNDRLLSGIHREFVHALWEYYGGRDKVRTGWVSNTLFEPSVGQAILRRWIDAETNIELWLETRVEKVLRDGSRVVGVVTEQGRRVDASLVIDATEYGDITAMSGATYRLGREAELETGEPTAPKIADDLVQDTTFCLTICETSDGVDHTIDKPARYDPAAYLGSIREVTPEPEKIPEVVHSWKSFIEYGRLPNKRFMINWPIFGNDYFAPEIIEQSPVERADTIKRMKDFALGFLYYIQTEAGHPELALDRDTYPTEDGLPLIPYIRESRRARTVETLILSDVIDRYANPARPLYRTGVAVGDYFIDHHHNTQLDTGKYCEMCNDNNFPKIQAVTMPMACLIPAEVDGLLVAEKSIGVTHTVNGVTRLQPIVMNIGQAAGALAAKTVKGDAPNSPRKTDVRDVQQELLDSGVLLLPFSDVGPEVENFQAIHRVTASGVMLGFDKPRQCDFRPDNPATREEMEYALRAIAQGDAKQLECMRKRKDLRVEMTRGELAAALDRLFDPFRRIPSKVGADNNDQSAPGDSAFLTHAASSGDLQR